MIGGFLIVALPVSLYMMMRAFSLFPKKDEPLAARICAGALIVVLIAAYALTLLSSIFDGGSTGRRRAGPDDVNIEQMLESLKK